MGARSRSRGRDAPAFLFRLPTRIPHNGAEPLPNPGGHHDRQLPRAYGAAPRRRRLRGLPPQGTRRPLAGRHLALFAQDPLGEPVAPRGWGERHGGGHRGPRDLGSEGRAVQGDRLRAGAGAHAGLHRCARGRGSGGDARGHGAPGRRSQAHQSALARRAGDRPLGAGGCLRELGGHGQERRHRVRA